MNIPELRGRVVELLQRVDEPTVRATWLEYQAHLWACPPSEVLSLLVADGRPLPAEPFAMVPVLPAGQRPEGHWEVMDSYLLTSKPVWLMSSGQGVVRWSWLGLVEALCGLMDELGEPIPSIGDHGADPDEWGQHAAQEILRSALGRMTDDLQAAEIAWAIVWKVLGFGIVAADSVPVPHLAHDPIDGWHDTLEMLTDAQSAAETVLTVLGVEGGGRDIRSLSLTKEG